MTSGFFLSTKNCLSNDTPYQSISAASGIASGVIGYDYGADYIVVYFTGGTRYKYTKASCGSKHIKAMKRRADGQQGLSTYIAQQQPAYASKVEAG